MVRVWALHWSVVFSETVTALGENGDGNIEKEADLCDARSKSPSNMPQAKMEGDDYDDLYKNSIKPPGKTQ